MVQKKLSRKDAKLIRDNPGKSPEELMHLGLSRAAYTRLASDNAPAAIPEVLQPVKVEKATTPHRLQNGLVSNHVVRVHNTYTNMIIQMGFRAASLLAGQNPEQFKIL